MHVTLTIDVERETDGRWLAEVPELPGDDTLVSLTFTRTTSKPPEPCQPELDTEKENRCAHPRGS
jgi:hypothetical protein